MSTGFKMWSQYIKLTGLLTRIILVIGFFLAIGTLLLWQFGEKWINRFDAYIINKYQEYYELRLSEAVTEISNKTEEGQILLEQLINDLDGIQKRDRLEHLKRSAFAKMVKTLKATGKRDQALAWAERWTKFDGLDLYAQLELSRLLYDIPERRKEGLELLDDLYRKLPESSLIAGEHAKRLYESGDMVGAFLSVYNIYQIQDSLSGHFWQIFWDTGLGFNESQRKDVMPLVDANGNLTISIEILRGVKKLRIDPPISSRIVISDPKLIRNDSGQDHVLNICNESLGLSEMTHNGMELITTGGNDPYFYWTLPTKFDGSTAYKGRITARVEEAFPEVMLRISKLADAEKIALQLEIMENQEAAKQLRILVAKNKKKERKALHRKK